MDIKQEFRRIIMIGNIGFTEILMVFGIALLIFGPKKLPQLGRAIGQTVTEFKSSLMKKDIDSVSSEVKQISSSVMDEIKIK